MNRHFLTTAISLALFLIALSSCGPVDEWQPAIDHLTDTIPTDTLANRTPCNGHPELCDQKYNEVAYATTNRSYRYEFGANQWPEPHQQFPVNRQLRDGIRAINLDVEDDGGNLVCYLGFDQLEAIFGSDDLRVPLQGIATFLADSLNDVVTLFLNTDVGGTAIMDALSQAGLDDYMHTQVANADWPTLQQMIDSKKNLVVFVNNQNAANAIPELHYTWDWLAATEEEVSSNADFSCNITDGNDGNDLYMLRHVVSTQYLFAPLFPDKGEATVANALNEMYARSIACKNSKNRQVNFVSVDFYNTGDLLQTIDILNGVEVAPF